MRSPHYRVRKGHHSWKFISDGRHFLLIYTLVMFFYYCGDTIMAYMSPVIVNRYIHSTILMGLILGFSSFIGFCCDLFFSKTFNQKTHRFFAPATLLSALLFPISFLFFPQVTPTFLFGMAIWGVYYELARFSHFNFIHSIVKTSEHTHAWSVLQGFQSLALLIAPLVAIFLIDINQFLPLWVALGAFIISLIGIYCLTRSRHWHKPTNPILVQHQAAHHTIKQEIRIWTVLMKKVWPVYLFLLALTIVDSSIWVMGTLLSEQFRKTGWLGNFLLAAYILPFLIVTIFASRLAKPWGKKRIAFLTAILGSVILCVGGLIFQSSLFVIVIFIASLFISVSYPEMYATFEDYVARLGEFGNDMVGVESSAISLGYVLGPILSGILATQLGPQGAIVALAILLTITGIIALIKVPRKVRLPQSILHQVTNLETPTKLSQNQSVVQLQ